MRTQIPILLLLLCLALYPNPLQAQTSTSEYVPAWMLSALPKDRKAAYDRYLNHNSGYGAKAAATAEHLIAIYNAQFNGAGAIAKEDSADYRYSGSRAGNPKPAFVYMTNMRVDMLFDSGISYTRGNASSGYQRETRVSKSFNAQQLPDSMLIASWTGTAWVGQQKEYYQYNSSGKESIVVREGWDPVNLKWFPSSRNGLSYNTAGDILVDSFQVWDHGAKLWVNSYKVDYSYEASGRLILMLQKDWNTSTNAWVPRSKDSISYTVSGKAAVWTSQIFYAASGVWRNAMRYISYYNSADVERARVTQADNSGTSWSNIDSTAHTQFNASGLPLYDSIYADAGAGWLLTQRAMFTYTPANLISTSLWERVTGGTFTNHYRDYHFYDNYDQLIRHYEHRWNGTAWTNAFGAEQRYHYEPYTTTSITISGKSEQPLNAVLYPVPGSSTITLSLQLASRQQLSIALIDNQGRHVQSWNELANAGAYTRQLPVSGLPTGNYTLWVAGSQSTWTRPFNIVR